MKHLLSLMFVVRIMFPMNVKVYDNVVIWSLFHDTVYKLELANGQELFVPVMWTVIEGKAEKK